MAHRHPHGAGAGSHHQHHGHADLSSHGDQGHAGSIRALDIAFGTGVALNSAFVIIEGVAGFVTHSLALMADAGHNLSDVFSLGLAWVAAWICRRPPAARRTYGFGRGTILASLVNALLLLIAVGAIALEAVMRLSEPVPVNGYAVAIVAAIGIAVNGGTALMLYSASRRDMNVRSAFLHMAADTAVSAGVVVAGCVMALTHWWWVDPGVSIVIAVAIAVSAVALLRESLNLALDAVPAAVDRDAVKAFLLGHAGVLSVHDLHIWPLSTTSIALTAHLVVPEGAISDDFLHRMSAALHERYGIDHVTIQVERGDGGAPCRLAPEEVV